ncbi:acetyl-CoA hydrolase/transferase family protein [Roseibium sp. RKSG952]|uniref:acetyl-CoA hydrolase/transferase family protein n=1 Tax=Roseibium sp. RKSG952 TaxID=2529384 RepID=UPI0012BC92F3|nr:acetyl-CoA hydrolase/transferase C-terminal domain-containing protein [Roseibium sp. RKSG952]MTH98909.1 acetyl-CoA hydrolase/transferase family protein [Roseibium sp. RKSG952]
MPQTSYPYADTYKCKITTAENAVSSIRSGEVVCSAMAIGQPPALLSALADRIRSRDLKRIVFYYKIGMKPITDTILADGVIEHSDPHCFFVGGAEREIIKRHLETREKLFSFTPCHFSQIPDLFANNIEVDTFIATVSSMDPGGFFSFGTNNDYTSIAARASKRLIVEVNDNMPRVFGQSQIHISEIDAIVENTAPLMEVETVEASKAGHEIGKLIAPMIPNGATLQLGIGRVPSGVTAALDQHEDLGIHSELLSPAVIEMIRNGNVTGHKKSLHPHKHVFTIALGNRDMYDFMNDNPAFESYPSSYVNDVRVIAQNDNLVSVNTALSVDLYGQVNAEFIDDHEYSGSGGQYDFVKGASLARNGKSIIALQSTAKGGTLSTIVPKVSMVTDLRMDIEYICTEFGMVNLRGKSTKERALALISIAHPDFRDELTEAARRTVLI